MTTNDRATPGKRPAASTALDNAGVAATLQRGVSHHQRGALADAGAEYRKVLDADPHHFMACHLLGVVELQAGRPESALPWLERARGLDPRQPDVHLNYGAALLALGRAQQALGSFDQALSLNRTSALAWSNRGNALVNLQRLDEAVESYRQALRCDPRDARAHVNLCSALQSLGRPQEALASVERALVLQPNYPLALKNRGQLLVELNRPVDALASFQRALQQAPQDTGLRLACARCLMATARYADAAIQFEHAARLEPRNSEALNGHGVARLKAGDALAALAAFDSAISRLPEVAALWSNRGEVLRRLNRFGDAARSYERALELKPALELGPGKRLNAMQLACDWSSYADAVDQVTQRVLAGERACGPFELLSITDSAAAQLACARSYRSEADATRATHTPSRTKAASERIRLAYVSADFGSAPSTYLMVGVFEQHDRQQFETLGISLRPEQATEAGRRVARSFDRFIDVSALDDAGIVGRLAELDVDIAIDLMGYTHDARPEIFARRAAPLQVAYLGHPGTTGRIGNDYLIADEFVIPGELGRYYGESVLYLPECFQANDDRRVIGARRTRRQVGLPDDAFVFAVFNNSHKLNPTLFEIWCRLLRTCTHSVLWMVADTAETQANLCHAAERHGVSPERLVFAGREPYPAHLARLALADLFLDTLPFNGGTTTSDALWAGLPVLTCVGEAFAARMSGSLLRALGLNELVTFDLAEYERRALELSTDVGALARLRARLAHARNQGVVFDTQRFCRHLEAGYRRIWERHRQGLPPATIRVPVGDTGERTFGAVP